jgi:hypothetical protein
LNEGGNSLKPRLNALEACHRLALIEGQEENKEKDERRWRVSALLLVTANVIFFTGLIQSELEAGVSA